MQKTAEKLRYKNLVPDALWVRLVSRIRKDHPEVDEALAERIMNETLAFIHACANGVATRLAPSPSVDIGWHTFILYTKSYTEFCETHAGKYIHHEPSDIPEVEFDGGSPRETVEVLKRNGYSVDEQLWLKSDGNCFPPCCWQSDCQSRP